MTENNNKMYEMVEEFHEAFDHFVADKPTPLDEKTALNRSVWTGEELIELLYGTVNGDEDKFIKMYGQFRQGLDDAFTKILVGGKTVDGILVSQADALTDALYFIMGSFVQLGVKPFELFEIVQNANMGKLWDDGKSRFREGDGEIVKPPHWEENFAPEGKLKAEIERQIEAAK